MADAQARIRITAQDDSAAAFKKATSNIEGLQASAASLAGSLGGALAVGGLTALITGAIDAADNLRDLSQATGITVESLGGLGFAAGQNGGSLEGVASAAGKLNKALAEAAAGSRAALEPFQALGISVQDAAGQTKNADVVFAEVADRFKTFNDGPEKSALALRLFGKAGAEQIALLNEGGDALRANIEYYKRFSGVTTGVAQAADQFNDTLGKVKLLSQSLGTSIAAALLPGLQAVADELLALKENGGGFAVVGSAIRVVFEAISITVANVIFVLKAMVREIGAIAAQTVALGSLDIKGFNAISVAVKEDAVRARAELDALERRILGIGTISANDESEAEKRRLGLSTTAVTKPNAPRLAGAGGAGAGDKTRKDLDLTNKALGSYLEQLDRQLQKNQDLSATEQALTFLRTKGAGATLDQAAAILAVAKALDLEGEQLDRIRLKQQLSIEAGNELDRANGDRAQRIQQLLASTPSAQFAQQQKDLDLLQESLAQFERSGGEYGISVTQYIEAVQKLAGISTELEKSKGLAEELGLSFTSAFEDAVVGGKGFSEVLKGLEQDILRIVTRKLVTEPLNNAITGAVGGGGGIGGIFGNLFKGLFGARASGGPVQAGGSYLVGERGPEIFKAPASGTIVPTSQLAGAGGRSMVIHINPPAGMSRQSSTQFAADVARQVNLANNRNN
jgi:hypothetical protein